ncbi:pyridoxal-phosphate dependent enzyme [Pseudomonas sp. CCM 7891]|uniref:cysteine synthase n=1 Tax=Pseudomonas karstica TaxID=1055468 RepID=A0A7X2RTT7_9PSED|nr:cysteine synthase family protein [Pseudomonas karstica]MTD20963.1 pyridoxal-phosphate dependent enzyme [Pseudomonas karstica]
MKLDDIGNTPLLEIERLANNGNRIFSKCEFMNPTGSHKDRTYLNIVSALESKGVIKKGMTLIDCSTGNGGAALAWIGKEKGYSIKIFMPEGMTEERKEQIRSFGAQIIETPKETFLNGSVNGAKKYLERHNDGDTYFLDQANTLLNKEAWHACGEEIVEALKTKGVVPDFFICSIGTGGTFSGIAEILKREYKNITTIGIEVDRSAPLYASRNGLDFEHHSHNLMGVGAGVLSVNTVSSLIDDVMVVDDGESWGRMKRFIAECDLGIGPTCGANLVVCEQISKLFDNKNIVTLFFDSSWKYKSRWDGLYPEYVGG